jgi:molybdenum cofactor synthesis domain-containing protein
VWGESASKEGNLTMATVNAEIVAIGSELLLGQSVSTNSAWMAQCLAGIGINLFYKTIVGDNAGRRREIISRALERSDVVITSGGGIGPTEDDLTREIVAEVTGRELVLDPSLLQQIEERFRKRGFIMRDTALFAASFSKRLSGKTVVTRTLPHTHSLKKSHRVRLP